MRVYLDTSAYNRQFDDQSQPRIWLETQAMSIVLQMIDEHEIELITSSVADYEISRNPNPVRRQWVEKIIQVAAHYQVVDHEIRERALKLESHGLKALDSLHLACAEAANAQYFVTCDDRLLRRYRSLVDKSLLVYTPAEFIENLPGD